MYCINIEDDEYWIHRLMIDAKYQSKGYGKAAMEKLIDTIKNDKKHHAIYISIEPHNTWGKQLYKKLGF